MASWKNLTPWFVIGATVVTLTGCGSQNSAGGIPSSQPLPPSTSHSTTPSTGTTLPQGGAPTTGSTSPSSTTTTSGTTSGTSVTTGTTTTTGTIASGQPSGSTVPGTSGSSVGTGTVAGSSTSGTTLTTMQVGAGSSNPFVPVSSQISDIYVPANWVLHTDSLGEGGNIYRLINSAQPAEHLVEVVQSSARDLAGFMSQISQGANAHYVIPQQVIEYAIPNPNLPYEDRGIVANLSNGGSIRLDVYLPSNEQAVAQKIIASFIKPLT